MFELKLSWVLRIIFFLSFGQMVSAQSADFSFTQDDVDKGSSAGQFQGSTLGTANNRQSYSQTYSMTIFTDQVGDPGKAPIKQYFEEKLGVKLDGSGPPGEQNIIVGDYPNFLVCFDGNYVLMTMSEKPREFSPEEMKWLYSDPRIQEKLDDHPSYVHVEMIQMRYSLDERDAFRILSVFAAGIVNPNATRAIASFSLEQVVLFEPEQMKILNGDNPRDLFYQRAQQPRVAAQPSQQRRPPVPQGSKNNRLSLAEAHELASKSFDSFKRSYSTRPLVSSYQVLSLQEEDDRSELVWFDVLFFSGNDVEGKVLSNPKKLLELQKDDTIRIDHDTIMNWKIISTEGNDQAIDPIIAIPSGLQ